MRSSRWPMVKWNFAQSKMQLTGLAAVILAVVACSATPLDQGSRRVNHTIDVRVVGGQLARHGQFPYQVSLRRNNRAFCGGALISGNYVLTAAHCVHNGPGGPRLPANSISVRVGTIRLNSGGSIVSVAEVKVHPGYRFPISDFALLRMSHSVGLTPSVRPVDFSQESVRAGSPILVSGFGATNTGGGMSEEMRWIFLTYMPDDQCHRMVQRHESIFCLSHTQGRGICQGDSGGPAVQGARLVGVMSFTMGGCGTHRPDGFAKLSYAYHWIRQNMR